MGILAVMEFIECFTFPKCTVPAQFNMNGDDESGKNKEEEKKNRFALATEIESILLTVWLLFADMMNERNCMENRIN